MEAVATAEKMEENKKSRSTCEREPPATLHSHHQQKSMRKTAGQFLRAYAALSYDPTIQVLRTLKRQQSTQAVSACRSTAAQGTGPEAGDGHSPINPGPGRWENGRQTTTKTQDSDPEHSQWNTIRLKEWVLSHATHSTGEPPTRYTR